MTSILISTIYQKPESIALSIRDLQVQKIVILVDKDIKEKQLESIDMLKKAFKDVIAITERKVELYDLLSVSKDVVEIIDSIPKTEKIYLDISQGRKLQALGVLFAAYARYDKIENIVYWGDNKKMYILPKLSFNINGDSKKIMKLIEKTESINNVLKLLKISKSKFYRLIKNLEQKGLIEKNNKYILTDAGKISIL